MGARIVRFGATGAGALLALGLLAAPPAGAAGSGHQNKAERTGKVTCFHPEGKTQGRSLSDPDGDSNGGADKPSPDCTGGVDRTDRDGNNGCGNDIDREDDNNGHCGRQQARPSKAGATEQRNDEAKVKAQKVDNDIEVRCQGHHRDTTTTTAATAVSAAGTTNTCSCAKDDSAAAAAGDMKLQAAALPAAEAATASTAAPTSVLGSAASAPTGAEATTTTTTAPGTQVLGETLSRPGTLARTGAGVGGLALLGGLLLGGGRLTVLARKLLRIG